jgi:hypothetical protein
MVRRPATESNIQALLRAQNPRLSLPPVMPLLPRSGYDTLGAMCDPRTPELLVDQVGIANPSRYNDASADDAMAPDDGRSLRVEVTAGNRASRSMLLARTIC